MKINGIKDGWIDFKDSYDHWKYLLCNPKKFPCIDAFYASLGWYHYFNHYNRDKLASNILL